MQGAVADFSFLAELCQPNEHNDQMDLVDPHEGYESNTLLLMGTHSVILTMGLSMTLTIVTTTAVVAMALVAITQTSGAGILSIWFTPLLLCEIFRLTTVVASRS